MPAKRKGKERVILYRMDLARRYGVDVRTIDRDHSGGVLPPAHYRRGKNRPFWYLDEIERSEKFRRDLTRRKAFADVPKLTGPKSVQLKFPF